MMKLIFSYTIGAWLGTVFLESPLAVQNLGSGRATYRNST